MNAKSPFAAAVQAIDTGNVNSLRVLLSRFPALAHECGPIREGYYFSYSTLLLYVAWNPYPSHRDFGVDTDDPTRMPAEMPDAVTTLLAAGADPRHRNGSGRDAVDLVLTGRLASESRLTSPILEALLEGGATITTDASTVHRSLANHAPEAARALLARGAPFDIRTAAGLGDLERVRKLSQAGETGSDELGLAALHAYVSRHAEVLNFLLRLSPNLNVIGVENGTLLHRACAESDLDLVERLTRLGADHNNRDNPFRATPLDWADHAGISDVVKWIVSNALERLDIHQAAAYGLTDRAERILREHSEAVNECKDIWRYEAIQPLRTAVLRGHRTMAALLVNSGASVRHIGGDGRTALEEARASGDKELVRILVKGT